MNAVVDKNEISYDWSACRRPAGRYGLTLPTSDNNISFTAEVTSGSTELMTQATVQRELVEALRQQAPLASLSAGDVAAKPQSMTYSFSGPTSIDPAADTMSLTVAGTTLTVNMADGDGLGNAVTTAQQLNARCKTCE